MDDHQTIYFYVPAEVRKIRTRLPVLKYGRTDAQFPSRSLHYMAELEVCFRISGEEEYSDDEINGIPYRTPLPHVLFKLPGHRHRYRCEKVRHAFFIHYPTGAPAILEEMGFPVRELFWPLSWNDRMAAIVKEMMHCSGALHAAGTPERIDMLAWQLLVESFLQRDSHPGETGWQEKAIREIASFLQLHYLENINIDSLITLKSLSRRSFFRYWSMFYRESPMEMIRALRINHAKELLLHTGMPVSEISAKLNFNHSVYFIRTFKAYTGLTPLQYRKTQE